MHRIGDLEDESGVTTDVLSGVPAVDEDVGDLIRPFEVEEETLPAKIRIDRERLAIPADPAAIRSRFVERIGCIPRVGKVDALPGAVVEIGGRGALDGSRRITPLIIDGVTDARRFCARKSRRHADRGKKLGHQLCTVPSVFRFTGR